MRRTLGNQLLIILFLCAYACLHASSGLENDEPTREAEGDQISLLHAAIKSNRFSLDIAAQKIPAGESRGVVIARRGAMLAGWLENENDFPGAIKVAKQSIFAISKLKEPDDASFAERAYWEAMLLGKFLGQQKEAVDLLEKARSLNPDDERLLELELAMPLGLK